MDIIIVANNKETNEENMSFISNKFQLKDLRNMKYVLGIELTLSMKDIFLFQKNTSSTFSKWLDIEAPTLAIF